MTAILLLDQSVILQCVKRNTAQTSVHLFTTGRCACCPYLSGATRLAFMHSKSNVAAASGFSFSTQDLAHSMFWCTRTEAKIQGIADAGAHFDQPCLAMGAFGCLAGQGDSLHDGLLGWQILRNFGRVPSSDAHEVGLKPFHASKGERMVRVRFACSGLTQHLLGRLRTRRKREDIWNLREPLRLGGGIRPEAPHNGQSSQEKRLVIFDFIEIQ